MKNNPYPKAQIEALFLIKISTESRSLRFFFTRFTRKRMEKAFS